MPESRGAASVTLDTIIAAALVEAEEVIENSRDISDLQSENGAAAIRVVAITDALLAKGHIEPLWKPVRGCVAPPVRFVIPLEAS